MVFLLKSLCQFAPNAILSRFRSGPFRIVILFVCTCHSACVGSCHPSSIRHSVNLIITILRMSQHEVKRLPQLDPVILIYPSSTVAASLLHHTLILKYSPISATIGNHPCPLHIDQHGGSEAGGSANAQPLKGRKRDLIKMALRNGTDHGFKSPRNYIAAVIVIT